MNKNLLITVILIAVLFISCSKERSQKVVNPINIGTTDVTASQNDNQGDNIILSINDNSDEWPWHLVMTDSYLYYYEPYKDNLDHGGRYFIEEKYDITLETVGKLLYMNFYCDHDSRIFGIFKGQPQQRLLVLYLDNYLLYLFNENNQMVVYLKTNEANALSNTTSIATATSELNEGGIIYSAKNITIPLETRISDIVLRPWAEGVKGSGIGEKITLTSQYIWVPYFSSVIIANGYIDYNKPYLYEYNNRVKKMRISRGDPDVYVDFELKDTPQFQKFDLDKLFEQKPFNLPNFNINDLSTYPEILSFTIEILDVYKGSHYDDTCITLIETWGLLDFSLLKGK